MAARGCTSAARGENIALGAQENRKGTTMISYKCVKCGEPLEAPDSLAGQPETCPKCGNVCVVPAPPMPVSPPPLPVSPPPPIQRVGRESSQSGRPASRRPLPSSNRRADFNHHRSGSRLLLIGIPVVLLLVAGIVIVCNPDLTNGLRGLPTEDDAKAEILKKLSAGVSATLISVRKTNGQAQEVFGVKMYTMEVEYEIEYTKDTYWDGNLIYTKMGGLKGGEIYKSGERKKLKCKIKFEKSENGWKVERVIPN